ncbi:MAG TPA: (5-formylfuran-3-yl)methyl phosphate synthase [Candidatus Acidoferrales bacterium]|nr:(5-formylfuran-3-yl)methyl phosphate synthase [Candidatus Acidoferrales bacterium]
MKILISPKNEAEAVEAVNGGADIIDVKNPSEGSLGANFPWVIKRIREIVPRSIDISATLGDFPHLPGSASLAALGAAVSGTNYIKIGLLGSKTFDNALFLMENVTKAVKDYDPLIKVVVAGYADHERANTLDPMILPHIAERSGCDLIMVDTLIKDGKRLFDFMDVKACRSFVERGHAYGLQVALAGSVKKEDVSTLTELGADVVGIRGAACSGGDRFGGTIKAEYVRNLKLLVRPV